MEVVDKQTSVDRDGRKRRKRGEISFLLLFLFLFFVVGARQNRYIRSHEKSEKEREKIGMLVKNKGIRSR